MTCLLLALYTDAEVGRAAAAALYLGTAGFLSGIYFTKAGDLASGTLFDRRGVFTGL